MEKGTAYGTVLVFEDEASSQEITRCALQRTGITDITLAGDGAGLHLLGLLHKPLLEPQLANQPMLLVKQ